MINAIVTGIFNLLIEFANIFTAPISALVSGVFPDIGNLVSSITDLLNMVVDIIGWFAYLIPPKTKLALIGLISFYISLKPLTFAIEQVNRTLNLIKRINIFSSK